MTTVGCLWNSGATKRFSIKNIYIDSELQVLLPCLLPQGNRTFFAFVTHVAGNYNTFIVLLLLYRTIIYLAQGYVDAM